MLRALVLGFALVFTDREPFTFGEWEGEYTDWHSMLACCALTARLVWWAADGTGLCVPMTVTEQTTRRETPEQLVALLTALVDNALESAQDIMNDVDPGIRLLIPFEPVSFIVTFATARGHRYGS